MVLGQLEKQYIANNMTIEGGYEKIQNFVNNNIQFRPFEVWMEVCENSCSTKYTNFSEYFNSVQYRNKLKLKSMIQKLS
jgi:hypothetical protein